VGLPVSLCDVAINPNNTDQRLVLWSNGRIDALGGAPTITASVTWYDRFEPPGRAITVSNWVTGAGYVLDYRGGFNPFNGAPDVGSGSTSNQMPGIPLTSAPSVRRYVDWAWDPALNGQGYVLDQYGQILPFGGASAPTFTGQRWNFPNARKLKMQFGATKRGVIMDQYGYLYPEFGATIGNIGPAWPGFNASRDMAVVAWNPITGYKLDLYGGLHGIGGLAKPSGFPYRKGADVGRVLDILSATNPTKFFVGWTQGQTYEVVSSTPPTVIAGVGINEVQTVTITGAPTGGTFTLTYSGQTTTALARTATAATVQAALEALSNIGVGDVVVTGGPGPTTPYVVTFTGVLGGTDTGQMTAAHTFTGGTTPGISVTTTTTGGRTSPATTVTDTTRPTLMWEYTDAQGDQQAEWQLLAFTQTFVNANTMTDPLAKASGAVVNLSGVDREQRGVKADYDFTNTAYRYYVRARDTAGQWSAWSNRGWTQSITLPTTPTGLTASSPVGTWKTNLSVTSGGTATYVQFQWSVDGVTWYPVRGAEAVPRLATTTAVDNDPPLGQATIYRALSYSSDPRVVSLASNTATATALPMTHVFTSTVDPALGGEVFVNEAPSWERPIKAEVLEPVGDKYAVVLTDDIPKARQFPVVLGVNTEPEWDKIVNLLVGNAQLGGTLIWRDPFGEVIYCKAIDSFRAVQKKRMPYPTESFPRGHKHQVSLSLVEIRPPYLYSYPSSEAPDGS
jgi:hypothetical protein